MHDTYSTSPFPSFVIPNDFNHFIKHMHIVHIRLSVGVWEQVACACSFGFPCALSANRYLLLLYYYYFKKGT